MPTRVFLIRHGATTLTAEDRFAGETDVPLSEIGRDQLERLSARLAHEKIAAIYSSPRSRTMDSARILARPHRLEVKSRDEFREISHGRWEGLTRAEVERRFAEEYARWEDDPFTFAPSGGETGLAVTARALPILIELVTAHPDEQIVIVSHKATIRLLLSTLLGFEARLYRDRLDQQPAALNIVDFRDPAHARLSLFNDTSHCTRLPSDVPEMPTKRLSKYW
jgi:broad specificity phosphatase PhoE